MLSKEEKERVTKLENETFFDKIFYGFACALFGAAIAMSIVFWADAPATMAFFGLIIGLSFVGGCLFGSKFFNVVGDVLNKIWGTNQN